MGIKRIVDTAFWTDGKVDEFSPEDKYFMLYLLTNPFSTQLGIYEISIKQVAFQLGYSIEAVQVLIDRFENKYKMIVFSKETNEIAILNFLRHSIIKGGKPVEDCIRKEMSKVKNKALLSKVFGHIANKDDLNVTIQKIIEDFINENKNEIENDNENENDNDNDDSLPVRDTNRQRIAVDFATDTAEQISSYEIIRNEIMSNKGNGDKVCEWCGCKTSVLHNHHFPIPKRLGGKEVVHICSNCHHEFHAKEGNLFGDRHSGLTEPPQPKTDYKQIVDLFNTICVSFPSVRSLSEARKKAIKARLNTYTVDDFKQCFENAEASSFLKGGNQRNWTATFDWLIKDQNMAKVLDGNYNDKGTTGMCSSFDSDEFFEAAIARSWDDKEPPKTAANDESIKARAEALKQQFAGK